MLHRLLCSVGMSVLLPDPRVEAVEIVSGQALRNYLMGEEMRNSDGAGVRHGRKDEASASDRYLGTSITQPREDGKERRVEGTEQIQMCSVTSSCVCPSIDAS